jgi:cardiolipin synthase
MSIATALFIADWLLRIILCGRVVMSRRPVSATLAWLLLLLVPLPWVGVIMYAIVGEPRLGWRRLERYRRLTDGFVAQATVFWRGGTQDWTTECEPYKHVANVATAVSDMPPLRGNHISFLGDSAHTIDSLIKDIEAAKSRVHLLYYIWMDRGAGELVVEALERAAARGVTCRVLVDAVGSKAFMRSKLPARLRAAGVKVARRIAR